MTHVFSSPPGSLIPGFDPPSTCLSARSSVTSPRMRASGIRERKLSRKVGSAPHPCVPLMKANGITRSSRLM